MEWVALGDNEFPDIEFIQAEALQLFMEDVFKVIDVADGGVTLENSHILPALQLHEIHLW